MAEGKNMVYCPSCGREYDALNTSHTCSKRDLDELEMARQGHEHPSTEK